jgi:hypothetical protein
MTKARDLSKLLSTANGKIAGANLDVSFENITDTGTEGTRVASGTTAQRGSTAGQFRFNSTTGLAEYYTGTAFKTIDAPPTVSSLDVTEVDSQAGGNQTIVITGSNFQSGATVTFIGASGTDFNASTVTVDSDTQITAVAPKASFLNAQEPYGVKVENTSGLSVTLASQINVDSSPSWSTASGSLGTVFNSTRGSTSFTVSATDSDGDTIAYSLQSGSLPAGASLNSATGAITGFSAVGSDTTSNFTLRATANSKTADRAFSIVVNAPVIQAFNYTGASQTFTVPSNVSSFIAYMWGAGGSGGSTQNDTLGGNGGAGAYVTAAISNYSAGQTFGILVGQSNVSSNNTTINAFGGGGNGGGQLTQRVGGSGGGRSEINIGTVGNTPNGTRILVAGGGGGGNARYQTNESAQTGGIGGYTSGGNGSGNGTVPTGGSQSAGGNAGSGLKDSGGSSATAGTAGIGGYATGGAEAIDTNYGAGGGGGGGYFGGGGGDGGQIDTTAQSGAGGSSYANPTYASSITHTNGSGQTAPQTGNTYYTGNIASGGNGKAGTGVTGTAGGHGRIVIVY